MQSQTSSFLEIADKHHITTDSAKDNAFIVHLPDKEIRFELIASKYAVKLSPDLMNECIWVDFCHNNLEIF
jgi:hypothetical protein